MCIGCWQRLGLRRRTARALHRTWGECPRWSALGLFSSAVPGILIGATTEWIFGVPIDLLSGHKYWWAAAMYGELGPRVGLAWNLYMFGVYLGVQYLWQAALICLALRRVQRVPVWAAVLLGLVSYLLTMLFWSLLIR
jgi:hypothetical protein